MLPCVQNVYRSLYPHDSSSVFQNNKANIKAALVNTAKLKDALQPELSVDSAGFVVSVVFVGSAGSSVFTTNLNSPKLGMGFGPLNTPSVSFVILEMLTCGSVALLSVENSVPFSVPASYGANMVMLKLSRHLPLLHKSALLIPMNQSGEGANIVISDTLEKLAVTSTSIPVLLTSGTSSAPPGRISFPAFFAVIWALLSLTRVLVLPENKIIPKLYLCRCNCTMNKFRSYF